MLMLFAAALFCFVYQWSVLVTDNATMHILITLSLYKFFFDLHITTFLFCWFPFFRVDAGLCLFVTMVFYQLLEIKKDWVVRLIVSTFPFSNIDLSLYFFTIYFQPWPRAQPGSLRGLKPPSPP